ncbi:MAG TPA: PAS domain S-box protein [Methylomirabilota bacterium]
MPIIARRFVLELRSHLLALALGAFVPLLAFAVVSTVMLHRHERDRREHGLRDTARALSLAVDRELQSQVIVLETLATSIDLDRLQHFRREAGRFISAQPGWSNLVLFDRAGRELAAVAVTGSIVEETRALVRSVAVHGRVSVSDVRGGGDAHEPVITVTVPVVRDGRIRYVLGADVPPVQISGLLRAQQIEDWLGAILDRSGHVLARSRGAERFVGRPAGPELMDRLRTAPEGSFRGRTLDGLEGFMAYSRAPFTGWTVAVMVPPDDLGPSARRSLGGLVGLGLMLGGLAVGLALLLGRRIAASMAELSATARALGRGETPVPVTSGIAEVNAVAASMYEAAALLAERAAERGRAEAALHERDERLRLALSAGQMITWDWDLRRGIIRWGDDVGVFRGDGCPHHGRVRDLLQVVHSDDRALLLDAAGRAAKDGTTCEAEFRVTPAGGSLTWLAVRGRAFLDAAGVPQRMLGVAMDVTARKRAEEDSVALAAIVQSSDDAIVGETCEGRIVSWNAGAERIYGYTAEEMKGQSEAILHPPEQRDALPRILARVRAGEHVEQTDAVRLRRDGTRIDVSVTVSPIRDAGGRITGASAIARDVTEQRRTERRLAALQTLTDAALSHTSLDGVVRELLHAVCSALTCDVASILLMSEDGQRLVVRASHGLPEEEGLVIPVGAGVVGRIAAEQRPYVIDELADAEIESPVLQARGVTSLLGVPLAVDARVVGVVYVATAARRRFSEDETRLMLLAADRIALAVDHARLFEAERAARAEAETANRLKDQFLATLSHELRTPLTSMLGWVRMLRSGRLEGPAAARALESVERSTHAQSKLIDDLLDVSRIVSGKLTMDLTAVDADEAVAAALEAVRPLAEARSIELTHTRAVRPCIVQGDAGRLQQVVWNLLSNAIKFTPDGGHVRAAVTAGESEVAISVTDTGKGIAPELLPEIFERFRQGGASRTHGGLGLGLAIVRHLVELHGGRVAARSEGVGLGATFTVHLPLAGLPAAAAAAAREGATEFPRLDGVRVLVVDDEPDARALLGTVLEQCGAAVAAVPSAAAALAALARERYDVLLSDISMPEEDGYQLMRKVRTVAPRLPAAAVTAFARAEDRDAALAAGFQLHVAKPVEPVALARAVESLVRPAA